MHELTAAGTCEIVTTSRRDRTQCRTRLGRSLSKMVNLKELSITHRKDVDISGLRATFRKAQVNLPSVTGLRIESHGSWSFLVEACPNVEVLVLADNLYHDDMMEASRKLKHLRHLELSRLDWALDDIEVLAEAMPHIQSLALKGEINEEYISVSPLFKSVI